MSPDETLFILEASACGGAVSPTAEIVVENVACMNAGRAAPQVLAAWSDGTNWLDVDGETEVGWTDWPPEIEP